jgi:hypothetical protein
VVDCNCLRHRKSEMYIHNTRREAAAVVLTEGDISKPLAGAVVPGKNGFRCIHDKKTVSKTCLRRAGRME